MKDNWAKIEDIFHSALELEPHARESFLALRCEGDPQLRSEIDDLLDGFEPESDFLNAPVFDVGLKALVSSRARSLVGRTFGPYEIVEKIGEGGMGEVFRAIDTKLDRVVAVKFLSDALESDGRARRQLAKEARAAAALDHPGICAAYGLEEFDGQHFIVMQHIAGRTLSDILRERRLDLEEFRSLGKQIIEAVAFAHSHGIIHRDLKPGNIMITDNGRVKMLDFGLAKAINANPLLDGGGESSLFSNYGALVGTVAYMSPEQLRGEKLDFRSDIFSLGIVLHEMLSGKNPVARTTQAETIAAILGGDLTSGQSEDPDVRRIIEAVSDRCLSASRDSREPSAAELLFLISPTIARRPRRVSLVAAVGLTLLISLLGIVWFAITYLATPPPTRTIAIMPVEMKDDPDELAYFLDALPESIGSRLSRIKLLKVRSQDFVKTVDESGLDLRTAGSTIGVDALLATRLMTVDGRRMLHAEMIRLADEKTIASSEFEIPKDSVSTVPDRLALWAIPLLLRGISEEEIRSVRTPETKSAAAREEYERGRFLMKRSTGDQDTEAAIKHFLNSKDYDQNYSMAWAGLADAYLSMSAPGVGKPFPPKAAAELARDAALKAIELDQALPDSYLALGRLASEFDWNWSDAESYFRQALAIDESHLGARLGLVSVLQLSGRFDEALRESAIVRQIDPISFNSELSEAQTLYFKGEFGRSLEILDGLELKYGMKLRIRYTRAYVLIQLNRYEEAIGILKTYYDSESEDNRVLAAAPYGYLLGRLNRDAEAKAVIAELQKISRRRFVPAQEKALIYLGMGDLDSVFRELDKSCQERFPNFPGWVIDPITASVRNDTRFDRVLKCANLTHFAKNPE